MSPTTESPTKECKLSKKKGNPKKDRIACLFDADNRKGFVIRDKIVEPADPNAPLEVGQRIRFKWSARKWTGQCLEKWPPDVVSVQQSSQFSPQAADVDKVEFFVSQTEGRGFCH